MAEVEIFSYEDAERLYGEIMSSVTEIADALGATVDDPRIDDLCRAIHLQLQSLYSYTTPPSR
jgi:hypothetical protein